jgi:hypothetical protein
VRINEIFPNSTPKKLQVAVAIEAFGRRTCGCAKEAESTLDRIGRNVLEPNAQLQQVAQFTRISA